MARTPPLSEVAAYVRRHDPDRFFTALFAPPGKREALLTLYAVERELARAPKVASQPLLALIRLQWWREVVEGVARRHEVATPLRQALDAGALEAGDLLAVIAAWEAVVESGVPDMAGTAGGIAVAAARLLGAASPEDFRAYGAYYGRALAGEAAVAPLRRRLPRAAIAAALPAVVARRGGALGGRLAVLAAYWRGLV